MKKELLVKVTQLAQIHINRFKGKPEFSSPMINEVYPLFTASGKRDILFEVKFSSSNQNDNGSAIIALSNQFSPIPRFTFEGPAVVELLQKKVGHWNFKTIYFTPLYMVAESEEGKLLAEIGKRPSLLFRPYKGKGRIKFNYPSFKKQFIKQFDKIIERKKGDYEKAWNLILKKKKTDKSKSGSTDYISPWDVPLGQYQTRNADHYWRLPMYRQIPPHFGVNNNDFKSGCVACAWLCLIGYYDNTTALDIMRGTHTNHSLNWSDYPDTLMMELSEYLGTFPTETGGGAVWAEDIHNGYNFITDILEHPITGKRYTTEGCMKAFQIVYDKLLTKGVPSVISVPGHALIAYGVMANMVNLSENHFLRVYTGMTDPSPFSTYIPFEELDGAWSMDEIETTSHYKLNIKSLSPPAVVDLGDELLIAYRKLNGNIGLLYSEDGENIMSEDEIIATGKGSPSVTYDDNGKYYYIAWAEEESSPEGPLRLYKGYIQNHELEKLPAPPAPMEDKNISPAILAFNYGIYYVWKSKYYSLATNIAYCPTDDLEKYAQPWPQDFGNFNQAFHKILPLRIFDRPTLASDGFNIFMGYIQETGGIIKKSYASIITKSGEIRPYNAVGHDPIKHESCSNLCYFNKTLYASTVGPISEVEIRRGNWYNIDNQIVGHWVKLVSRELYWPGTKEYSETLIQDPQYPELPGLQINPCILSSFGKIDIGPCLLSCWIDHEGYIHLHYHSVDRPEAPLDYDI